MITQADCTYKMSGRSKQVTFENSLCLKGHFQTSYRFDFFNYAGIHRGVYLYAVPDKVYINDINFITVDVAKDLTRAVVKYQVKYFVDSKVAADATVCRIELLDKSGMAIAEKMNCVGEITVGKLMST